MSDMGKVRTGAHDTEVEAAERVGLHLRESQQQVLDLLAEYGPMNDDKLRRMLSLKFGPQSKSGPATRRGELVEQGIVRKARDAEGNVVKAPSDAGGNMTVWERVPDGERVPAGVRRSKPEAAHVRAFVVDELTALIASLDDGWTVPNFRDRLTELRDDVRAIRYYSR